MSKGWSSSDKSVAQKAAIKAKSAAEAEAVRLHKETKIVGIEDLWTLELKIRDWRKDRQHVFTINYETAEANLSHWIAKGWIELCDVGLLSEDRFARIEKESQK